MAERAYTVSEIDELRSAVTLRYMFGTTAHTPGSRWGRTYNPRDKDFAVEQQVRTYMLAGITAHDIYAEDTARAVRETP